MPEITIRYKGKTYKRIVEREFKDFFSMTSKGVKYYFKKDYDDRTGGFSWQLVNCPPLDKEIIEQISDEIDRVVLWRESW